MGRSPSPPLISSSSRRRRDKEREREKRRKRSSRDRDRDHRERRHRSRGDRGDRDRSKDRDRSRERGRRSRSNSYDRDRPAGSSSGNYPSTSSRHQTAKVPAQRPAITDADLEGKSPEEQEMMKTMGFCGFDTTKNKKVEGNEVGDVHVILKRKYRQYMNRKGGFNRPLDFVA